MKIKQNIFTMFWTTLTAVIFMLSLLSVCQAEQVAQAPIAKAPEVVEQKIVIRNITFVDPAKKKKNTTANLIITNKLFDLVTQDDIDVGHGDIIFDAQNGFILGSLEPGEIANFLVLDANPHENIEALLDTKKHVLLAIHNGVIIRNNLRAESNISAIAEQKRVKPKRTGWLSYTPPPIVLPSNYKDADWIKFDNDYFSTILILSLIHI